MRRLSDSFQVLAVIKMLNTETISAQANAYFILARLFGLPDKNYHGLTETYEELIHEAEKLEPKFLELSRKLSLSAKEETIESLREEYLRLFDPDRESSFTSLQAKAYLTRDDAAHEHLLKTYEAHEFVPGIVAQAPDHVCTELEFVSHLNMRMVTLLKAGSTLKAMELHKSKCSFMRDHFMKWLPELTRYIIFNSNSPYFLQLSIIARTVLINCINRDSSEK